MRQTLLKIAACKSQPANRSRGFTLTEVVVASALLSVAMVPILEGLTAAHLNTAIIEHKSRSLILAQAKLDDIKARSVYNYSISYAATNLVLDVNSPHYLCNVSDSGSGDNLRTITVSVGFDLNGNSTITLSTKLARRWNSG